MFKIGRINFAHKSENLGEAIAVPTQEQRIAKLEAQVTHLAHLIRKLENQQKHPN